MSSLVVARHLSHTFGEGTLRQQVLTDINLEILPGEIVILSGPSGSGKTTLLTLIGGLRSHQSGTLTVLGRDLQTLREPDLIQIRRHIGYIFQAHNLLQFLTAQQNVQMSLRLHKVDNAQAAQQAAAALSAVGLAHHLHAYPHQLSGGQKQRVAIARAMVCRPKLILADEPTASLDKRAGREVVTLMQRLVETQGCAVLMVTHDSRILDIATRIVTMEDGKLVESATTPARSDPSSLECEQTQTPDLHSLPLIEVLDCSTARKD